MNILEKILAHKRAEVDSRKELYPVKLLEKSIFFESGCVSLKQYLNRADRVGIIAEIKRRSPSKGMIHPRISVEKLSLGYMQAGASALSVLTDREFFGGSNEDLIAARKFNFCPILRKDFVVDEYQLIEAKSIGADAVLLIAAALPPLRLRELAAAAGALGLEVLLEVHNPDELERSLCPEVDLVGVNNRNLSDMSVNVETSIELVSRIPQEFLKVSESGIDTAEKIVELKRAGFMGFLIGEAFMRTARPEKACRQLIDQLRACERISEGGMLKIKVCGLRDPQNIEEIAGLLPDYMGFIFYDRSPRFVGLKLSTVQLRNFDSQIKRVGVFVDQDLDLIVDRKDVYFLDAVQLHGAESPEFCRDLQQRVPGLGIIKAFGVDSSFDFSLTAAFEPYCALFLFDTKTSDHGGSGRSFEWELLSAYKGQTPFLLSGGIGRESVTEIRKISAVNDKLEGIDLNSRVEVRPGIKSFSLVKGVIDEVRTRGV